MNEPQGESFAKLLAIFRRANYLQTNTRSLMTDAESPLSDRRRSTSGRKCARLCLKFAISRISSFVFRSSGRRQSGGGKGRSSSELPGLHELVDVLISSQHRLILLQGLILAGVRAVGKNVLALDAVLTVLGGLHVPEETQDVRIVAAGLPELVQLPGQLRGDQVRVGREPCRAPVHRADRVFPAALRVVSETREDGVETRQQRRVERIIVGQHQRTSRDLVEDLRPEEIGYIRVHALWYVVLSVTERGALRSSPCHSPNKLKRVKREVGRADLNRRECQKRQEARARQPSPIIGHWAWMSEE